MTTPSNPAVLVPLHATMFAFVEHLRLAGKAETAATYQSSLRRYAAWLAGRDPLAVTTDDIRAFQRYLAEDYRDRQGRPLGVGTQSTRLAVVKAYYEWMERRNLIAVDVARPLRLPRIPSRPVQAEYLSMQEVVALLQTQANLANAFPEGCARWADAVRSLAFLTLAVATGRRRSGLRALTVDQVDDERGEIRVEREKGRTGRVLPVSGWGMAVVRIYRDQARPILNWYRDNPFLFVGDLTPQLGKNTMAGIVERAHAATVAANPDLDELAAKHITPHSLRVSFAHLLFEGGANIRTINELMLHEQLGTTARYTPVPLETLRRVCATAHPRA